MQIPRPIRHRGVAEESSIPTVRKAMILGSVWRGIKGGLVATIVMTVFRLPMFRALPPTAEFWATYLGEKPAEAYQFHGLVLHVVYGSMAGAAFGPVFAIANRHYPGNRNYLALLTGLIYGVILSLIGTRLIFPYLLREDLQEDEALVFHVGHIIYGLTLGMWFGTHARAGEVYD